MNLEEIRALSTPDLIQALLRRVRIVALEEALGLVIRMSPDTGPEPTLMETELRAMIAKE